MRTVRSLFSVSGSSLLAWGLLVSVTSGCGKGDDGPKLNCPNGMRTIWLDALNNVGECEVITPLGDGRAPRSGLEQAYPAMNRPPGALTTPERIELGRLLYFDPILSGDNSVACASCHHPANGIFVNAINWSKELGS